MSGKSAPGRARARKVHLACRCGVVSSVEVPAVIHAGVAPLAAKAFIAESSPAALIEATCPACKAHVPLDVAVVYHDPKSELFALVLAPGQRHRELSERAALYTELAADTDAPVPEYIRRFEVVYGKPGLRELLAAGKKAPPSSKDDPGPAAAIAAKLAEIERREAMLDDREAALARRAAELTSWSRDLERARTEGQGPGWSEGTADGDDMDDSLAGDDAKQTTLPSLPFSPPAAASKATLPSLPQTVKPAAVLFKIRSADATDPGDIGGADFGGATAIDPLAGDRDPGDAERTSSWAPLSRRTEEVTDPFEPVDPEDIDESDTGDLNPPTADRTEDDSDIDSGSELALSELSREGDAVVADEKLDEPVGEFDENATKIGGTHDVAIERWIVSKEPSLKAIDDAGQVRFAVSASGQVLENLLGDRLQVKVQLHRMPTHPMVVLSVGSPDRDGDAIEPYVFLFNVGNNKDRAVLEALGREVTFGLDLYDTEYLPVRKRTVSAALAENVRLAAATAARELERIEPSKRSFTRAEIAFSDPAYDRHGMRHPERREFREDVLSTLDTPRQVLAALALARRFSNAGREDYLLLVRGYPLRLWHARRRRVLRRATELGLWPGRTLALICVREGLAQSQRELIGVLQQNFSRLLATTAAGELSEEESHQNWDALRHEADAVGLDTGDVITSAPRTPTMNTARTPAPTPTPTPRSAARSSEAAPMVSGLISSAPAPAQAPAQAQPAPVTTMATAKLVELCGSEEHRLAAALELARRREGQAVGAVFASLARMTRGEAVQVLGSAVRYGIAAMPYLLSGLGSRKAFIRQGCALVLGMLKTEEAIEAIADALVSEPTDVWREVARAIGEVGPQAVMPVLSRLRDRPERGRERVAWALAYVAARGDSGPIETLAKGRDKVAATVAQQAIKLVSIAGDEDAQVRNGTLVRDETVNKAFTRRFFDAAARAASQPEAHRADDLSVPAIRLDESDLLEARDADP